MTTKRTVLVTGGTGRLGEGVCAELAARGHTVRVTDRKFSADVRGELLLGDLLDEMFVYRALQGCDAVVHLGNHPNAFAGPSRQRLLGENTTINANVVCAATDLGIKDIVFASSIQAMLPSIGNAPPPYAVPYLPIDGKAKANPGNNTYAQSKEFCERLLQVCCETDPELSATALRFPMLPGDGFMKRLQSRGSVRKEWLNFGEVLAFLAIADAATLVAAVLEKRRAGYHQYFPALSQQPEGVSVAELIRRYYAGVPLNQPIGEITSLIDISELESDFGWVPKERITFTLDET